MYSALYYPHTAVQSEGMLKTALLLWDNLEYISPYRGYKPWYNNSNMNEASELLMKPIFPTAHEKRMAHEKIISLLDSNLPENFQLNLQDRDHSYLVYAEKLLPETWKIISRHGYALPINNYNGHDFATSTPFGLSMMAILANVCAGSQKDTVTDQIDNYNALTRYFTVALGGDNNYHNNDFERIVAISVQSINTNTIELRQLIDLRKNEGSFLRELRTKYRNNVEAFITQISKSDNIYRDVSELERIFEANMKDDYSELKKALRIEVVRNIFSKELVVAIIAVAGAITTPLAGTLIASGIAGGALIKKDIDYRMKRIEILKKHPSSWLYMATNKRKLL